MPDPTRLNLRDELSEADGRRASEKRLPMTRLGVIKHLKLLGEAVSGPGARRAKLHFLNPVAGYGKHAAPRVVTQCVLKQKREKARRFTSKRSLRALEIGYRHQNEAQMVLSPRSSAGLNAAFPLLGPGRPIFEREN
jgi:hypothetical protein